MAEPTAQLDYKTYLGLEQILSAQRPLSSPPHHDEMLFIVQHQTAELWFKLIIHELTGAMIALKRDEPQRSLKALARVSQVQHELTNQWSVLDTLTARAYAQFRYALGAASGIQSAQHRTIEFILGNKDPQLLAKFRHDPPAYERLKALLETPTLYDEFLRFLARSGLPIPKEILDRDVAHAHAPHPEVTSALTRVYTEPRAYGHARDLAEGLVGLDEARAIWRFRHFKVVSRLNGNKRGTGGTTGASYLEKLVSHTYFPELWEVRTELEETRPPDSGLPLHSFWPR